MALWPSGGDLRTSLRLDDSLGLPGLRKAFILTVMVYYTEKIQIKISKGKTTLGWSPGEARQQLPNVPCRGDAQTGTRSILPAMGYDNTCEMMPTKEESLSLGVQVCYWGQSHRFVALVWPNSAIQSLGPQRSNWYSMAWGIRHPKAGIPYKSHFSINHLVSWYSGIQGLRCTNVLLPGRVCQGLRGRLPGASPGPVLTAGHSWDVQGLSILGLWSQPFTLNTVPLMLHNLANIAKQWFDSTEPFAESSNWDGRDSK